MIPSLHNWSLQLLTPDLSGPVTHGQEVLGMSRISLKSIDRPMMFSAFQSESLGDFNLLPLVCLENISLFSSNQVFERSSVLIVFERSSSQQLRCLLIAHVELLLEIQLIYGTVTQLFVVPPKDSTIS